MMIRTEYTTVEFDSVSTVSTQHLDTEYQSKPLKRDAIASLPHLGGGKVISEVIGLFTIVAIFPNKAEAKNAILEMKSQGLSSSQILMIAKEYQAHENSINWEYIAADGGLVIFLTQLGIGVHDTFEFVNAVDSCQFLVVAIITDRSASQAQHILEGIGRKVVSVY